MALIRLLQRRPDGAIVFREPTSDHLPAYAILSHTWGKEEVTLQDVEADADRSKTASKARHIPDLPPSEIPKLFPQRFKNRCPSSHTLIQNGT